MDEQIAGAVFNIFFGFGVVVASVIFYLILVIFAQSLADLFKRK